MAAEKQSVYSRSRKMGSKLFRKKLTALILAVICLLSLSGCQAARNFVTSRLSGRDQDEDAGQGYNIYYIDNDGNKITAFPYKLISANEKDIIDECIAALAQEPSSNDYRAVLGGDVQLLTVDYPDETKTLRLYFSEDYLKMDATTEILVRAAIVKTLTQFSGIVNYVSFGIGDDWIKGEDGQPMKMCSRDFVSFLDLERDQIVEAEFTLYFAAPDGKKLRRFATQMRYDHSSMRPEQAVLNALIRGPSADGYAPSLSKDTQIRSTYIRDGVCMVDFNQGFLEKIPDQHFSLNLYSVVNSLSELEEVNKVQITVDGKPVEKGPDGVKMSEALEANMELVLPEPEKETGESDPAKQTNQTEKAEKPDSADQTEKAPEQASDQAPDQTEQTQ